MVIQTNVRDVVVQDELCERISLVFREFLTEFKNYYYFIFICRFEENQNKKYILLIENMRHNENHTLTISYNDVDTYNNVLSNFIQLEYLRFLKIL